MARRKPAGQPGTALVPVTASSAKAAVINAGRAYDPNNPHTWLRLVGEPSGTDGLRVMCGTLRRRLGDNPQVNSAEAFCRRKCRPVDSPDPLALTALRCEVLVPAGVDDSYADPWLLPRLIDHALARETDGRTAVLCYATITDPHVQHLHEQWRTGRRMVERLVDRFAVPMILVQHAPEQAASGNAPHLHVMAAARMLGRGFGAQVSALVGDKARDVFVRAWDEAVMG